MRTRLTIFWVQQNLRKQIESALEYNVALGLLMYVCIYLSLNQNVNIMIDRYIH